MKTKYQLRYEVVFSEGKAREFCEQQNKKATYYMRKHHPAHYTPWDDGKDYKGFICWYYL